MPNLVSDDFEFEDVPELLSEYTRRSRMVVHPPGFLRWSHPVVAHTQPHGHIIMEDLPVQMKNDLADHIESFHKNKRRTDAGQ